MISLRDVVTGFGVRDPLAEVWRRSLRGGGGGAAEITGVPPLRYIGDGRPLTDYRIAGNAVQDGTPSHDAPVDAAGCGVRTGNLWDEDYTGISGNLKYVPVYVGNGSFTLSTSCPAVERAAALFLVAGNVQSGASTASNGVYEGRAITVSSIDGYVTVVYRNVIYASGSVLPQNEKTMLNLGSTALPYEPYGYKLPLTVNGTEYPIYLGQVETTRKIKKLVLDGEEAWQLWNGNYYSSVIDRKGAISTILCTHFINSSVQGISYNGQSTSGLKIASVAVPFVSSVNDLKAWLAAQYANGTPVTVWYVLATPTTGIVNEPLMKIGDYADTISFAQSGVAIPTVNGANVLDVPTEVKPSEITIKGGISSV